MGKPERLGPYLLEQPEGVFPLGEDTLALGRFATVRRGWRVCDLGCGSGLLGLLLLQRQPELRVTGIDLLPEAVRLARRAAAENGLTDRLTVLLGDLRAPLLPAGGFDLAVCNPPYYPVDAGRLPPGEARRLARSETACSLPELCRAAARLVRWGGDFCLVHKPERLADLCCALREAGLEPKRLRWVCRTAGSAPSLLLLSARRGGKPGLAAEAPLVLQASDGGPTPEVDAIYFRQQEDMP